jgi:hypothetical protein
MSIACTGDGQTEVEAAAEVALIGGTLSSADHDAVVFIRTNHENGEFDDCTGTLVSPHVVITAKHCVTLVKAGEFVCTGAGVLVENGQGAGLFGAKIPAPNVDVFTGAAPTGEPVAHGLRSFTTQSSDACHDDVAALVLDTAIQLEHYPPIRVARSTNVGESVRLVGYGTVGHELVIERRELADVRVLDVGSDVEVDNPRATTPSRTFVVGGGTACFGDSGGPALSIETGALAGVYSRITGDCFAAESRNTFMLAASFSSLFTQAFEAAGEHPLTELEPDAEPSNSGGAGGAEAGTAGTTTTTESADLSRHEAMACSLGRPREGKRAPVTAWLALLWGMGIIRRCCARSPFAGD